RNFHREDITGNKSSVSRGESVSARSHTSFASSCQLLNRRQSRVGNSSSVNQVTLLPRHKNNLANTPENRLTGIRRGTYYVIVFRLEVRFDERPLLKAPHLRRFSLVFS